MSSTDIECSDTLSVRALPGIPLVAPGDDLAQLALAALERAGIELVDSDVLVVASKIVSRAENRFVDLTSVKPSARAEHLATRVQKDPRLVELVLSEAAAISRAAPGVLIVRHRLGFVCAEAGIDFSNAQPPAVAANSGPWALLLPAEPDASAARLRGELERKTGASIGVVISDSHGRPFRLGSLGTAIGISGLPALWDRRGEQDLFGRTLEHTVTPLADQVASAADLVAGQAAERRAIVHVRGVRFSPRSDSAQSLCRPLAQDLYAAPGEELEA
jgi:coenzyme F420-0:L-glutamate ligase / coenzyme F420-1:gamma-L-glutamate ligase